MVEDEVVVEGGDVVGAEVDMETIKVVFHYFKISGK